MLYLMLLRQRETFLLTRYFWSLSEYFLLRSFFHLRTHAGTSIGRIGSSDMTVLLEHGIRLGRREAECLNNGMNATPLGRKFPNQLSLWPGSLERLMLFIKESFYRCIKMFIMHYNSIDSEEKV